MAQSQLQLEIPKLSEFKAIGKGRQVLPYAVRKTDGHPYRVPYLEGITHLQQVIEKYPKCKLFIPNSPDIHALFKILKPEEIFQTSTGTIVLRKDKDGYVDKRFTDLDDKRVELRHTSIAEHGISWMAKSASEGIITDPDKLKKYTELDTIKKAGMYRVAGYDEERGVVTKFNPSDKPVSEYNNAHIGVDPSLTFVPLDRGYWSDLLMLIYERLFISFLNKNASYSRLRFPLGSMAADSK